MTCTTSAAVLAALLALPSVPAPAAADSARTDQYGDPLPPGALLRLGTLRWRACASFLAFLPDGKTLLADGVNAKSDIGFWDPATGKLTRTYHPASHVTAFALAPDGKSMALGLGWESKGVVFVGIPDGKELRRIEDASTYFHHLSFSPDGKWLAGAGNDRIVRVWEAATGKEMLRDKEEGFHAAIRLTFSPDGKTLAVGRQPDTFRLLEVATGKQLLQLERKQKEVAWATRAGFSPDGKQLFWMGEDPQSFAIRDASTGEPLRAFRVPKGTIRPVAFSPDGKLIASHDSPGDGLTVIGLWDAATGKELRRLTAPHADFGGGGYWEAEFVFSPDGKRLAAGDNAGLLHVWDVETGKDLAQTGEHHAPVRSVGFSPDGRTALTGCADKIVRLWDADKGTVTRRIDVGGGGSPLDYNIVFSNDRKVAAVTAYHGDVDLWDIDLGKKRARLEGVKDGVFELHFAPDGKRLAARGSWESFEGVPVWDAETGKKVLQIGIDVNGLGSLAFSPDGKTLIAERNFTQPGGDLSIEASLWDTTRGKEIRKWSPRNRSTNHFQYSPDGLVIAAAASGEVDLCEAATGKELYRLLLPDARIDRIGCLAFSPDGRMLAGGDTDAIYLWEVGTGKLRAVLTGHRDTVLSLDFSPDGRRLISGGADTTALIWDLTGLADDKGTKALTPERLASLWDDLAAADAGKAWRAGWRLAADPAASVPFLQTHLHPAEVDAKRIALLLAALDGDDFDGRERASRELAKLGDLAGPAVRKALEGDPSSEARRRLEDLASKLDGPVEDAEQARALRAVEVLEHIGTAEARRLLDELGQGAAGARLTRDAKAAATRLAGR